MPIFAPKERDQKPIKENNIKLNFVIDDVDEVSSPSEDLVVEKAQEPKAKASTEEKQVVQAEPTDEEAQP